MDKTLPARTETSGLPSELSRASISTAWGAYQQVLSTMGACHGWLWPSYLETVLLKSCWGCFRSHTARQTLIYESLDREAAWRNGKGGKKNKTQKKQNLPSQTILCWQGKKWMSKASSEQTRHSVGTATLETLRLVIVLGVVCTRRRLQVTAEQSEETCCSLQQRTPREI